MEHLQTALIPFRDARIVTARDADGRIYVALKPFITAMGLDWKSQHAKIREDSRFNYGDITMIGLDGKKRKMGSLDLDHLPAFLYSINPNRVKKELRDRIIAFQAETFAVINDYWRKKSRPIVIESADTSRLAKLEREIARLRKENDTLREYADPFIANGVEEARRLSSLLTDYILPSAIEQIRELRERVEKELGTVGGSYIDKLVTIEKLFNSRPRYFGDRQVLVGRTVFHLDRPKRKGIAR
jgi:hypothetical protein